MNDKTKIVITAILCLTTIECVNLMTRGPNGTILGVVIATISGLAGFILKSVSIKMKESK